jgi:hypothetical protein
MSEYLVEMELLVTDCLNCYRAENPFRELPIVLRRMHNSPVWTKSE